MAKPGSLDPNKLQHLGGFGQDLFLGFSGGSGGGAGGPGPNGCLFKALVSFKRSCSLFPAADAAIAILHSQF